MAVDGSDSVNADGADLVRANNPDVTGPVLAVFGFSLKLRFHLS